MAEKRVRRAKTGGYWGGVVSLGVVKAWGILARARGGSAPAEQSNRETVSERGEYSIMIELCVSLEDAEAGREASENARIWA
jgi:hypothetical protein